MIIMPSLCKHPDCRKGASFGLILGKPLFCKEHKTALMAGVRRQYRGTCEECNKQPTFGIRGGERTHCATHKTPDMINLKSKTCEHDACNTLATFGFRGGRPTNCAKHKTPDMINLKDKLCEHDGCETEAYFGIKGSKKTHCAKHKTPDMIDLKNKTCEHDGCNTRPCFGIQGGEATYCAKHKTPDMINVASQKCVSEWCTYVVQNDKFDGFCTHCFKNLFPRDERTSKIRTKTKEELVRDAINEHFEGFEHDKAIVWGGCDCNTRRRIDHRKLINGTMLAIETDEHQHRSYDAQDEENRYNDLFVGAYSGKWIFIRFNPDTYTDSKGKRRKAMFDYNGKQNYVEVKRRKQLLIAEIEKQIKRIESDENCELLEIKKLFFDGF